MLLLLTLACSLQRPAPPPDEIRVGAGWAARLPEGARVGWREETATLTFDAPDGAWWIDVAAPAAGGRAALAGWAAAACTAVAWDREAHPAPGVTTASGLCTQRGEQMWLLAAVEERDGDAVLIALVGDRRFLPLEDAWVAFVRHGLSLGSTEPVDTDARVDPRRVAREVARDGGIGSSPVPGGGELSPRISEALGPLWAARAAAPLARPGPPAPER